MDTDKARSAIRSLVRVRNLFDEALSPASSVIPIDLMLAAASLQSCAKPGREVTVKQLFAQVRHSDRAVRMHFNQLVTSGMLIAETGPADRRTKVVRVSPRGEKLLQRVALALQQAGDRPAATQRHARANRAVPPAARSRNRPAR